MVDGSFPDEKEKCILPPQAHPIRQAFAGDDVGSNFDYFCCMQAETLSAINLLSRTTQMICMKIA
jgi:hypothetical protein